VSFVTICRNLENDATGGIGLVV